MEVRNVPHNFQPRGILVCCVTLKPGWSENPFLVIYYELMQGVPVLTQVCVKLVCLNGLLSVLVSVDHQDAVSRRVNCGRRMSQKQMFRP